MYASFEPLEKDVLRKRYREKHRFEERNKKVQKLVKECNLKRLESDYWGIGTYYYDSIALVIWFDDTESTELLQKPQYNEYYHIAKLNKIKVNPY